ncbi:MAG: hypothetical protein LPL00_02415 [Alphaproteobacteria bacterium]|nr:hypothetical protein [Alphaproteobacteria bacterium]MDX5368282.1 hypothetical protein [Alphaproteobacteria bacterium]MDX5463088.1 hypothetical protein [Alphaproteobacteria bacterium]
MKLLHPGAGAVLAASLAFGAALPAFAETSYPHVTGEVTVEVESDVVYKSDAAGGEVSDTYLVVDAYFQTYFTENWSLVTYFYFEPTTGLNAGEDRFFTDEGGYVEELYISYEDDWGRAWAGKFDVNFGTAHTNAPGIYGTNFAEDYQILEQLGGGVQFSLSPQPSIMGEVSLSVAAFFADRTILSESWPENRGRLRKSAGGAGNTSGPQSFAIALDGAELPTVPGFTYHLGVMYRAGGQGDPKDEMSLVLGGSQEYTLGESTSLFVIGELARVANQFGTDDDASYATLGAQLDFLDGFNVNATGAYRHVKFGGGGDTDDLLFTAGAGYTMPVGPGDLGFDVAWRYGDEFGVQSETVGALLSYTIAFGD